MLFPLLNLKALVDFPSNSTISAQLFFKLKAGLTL